jgi:hypothetical protein
MQADLTPQHDSPILPASGEAVSPPLAFTSSVLDRTEDWGRRRLMAVTSVRAAVDQQNINAEAMLDEIASAFFASTFATLDTALTRSIESCLAAVLPGKSSEQPVAEIGFAIVALEGERLLIAVKSPCLAVMRQESDTYLLPARPVGATLENAKSLPHDVELFETNLADGDHVGLLAAMEPAKSHALLSGTLDADDLEQSAGENGAYVWLEAAGDEPPAAPIDVSASTIPLPARRVSAMPSASLWDQPASRGPGLFNRPPGADALRRYRTTSNHSMPSSIRARLPRGVPSLRAIVLAVVIVTLVVSAGVVAASRRPTPTYPVGASVEEYSAAVASAIAADDGDLVTALMPGAQKLLENAQRSGASDDDVADLRLQIVAASDYLDRTVRLLHPRRLGVIPESLLPQHPRLVEAAGSLYLIAGSVFAVNPGDRQLIAMPEFESSSQAGLLANGAGDLSTLVLASGESAIFNGDATGGMLEIVADWPVGFGLEDAYSSVFQGRLYLLDRETAEIVMVDPISQTTSLWLTSQSDALPEEPVGMVVDGGIQVLYPTGEIYSLNEGIVTNILTIDAVPRISDPVAMALGSVTNMWYLADFVDNQGRLTAYDLENNLSTEYFLGPDELGRLDTPTHRSFASMSHLLISESNDAIYWIADGAIWTADIGEQSDSAGQDS